MQKFISPSDEWIWFIQSKQCKGHTNLWVWQIHNNKGNVNKLFWTKKTVWKLCIINTPSFLILLYDSWHWINFGHSQRLTEVKGHQTRSRCKRQTDYRKFMCFSAWFLLLISLLSSSAIMSIYIEPYVSSLTNFKCGFIQNQANWFFVRNLQPFRQVTTSWQLLSTLLWR